MKKVVSFSGGRTSAYLCYLMKELFGDDVDFVFMDTGAEHPKTYEFIRNVNEHFGLNLTCLRGDFNQPIGQAHTYKIVSVDDIKPDLSPYREMVMKYGTPTVASAWCTSRMKEEVHDKYCNDKYGKGNYETWLGMRTDEPARLFNQKLALTLKQRGFQSGLTEHVLKWANTECLRSKVEISGVGLDDILGDLKLAATRSGVRYLAELEEVEKQDVNNFWSEMPFDLGIQEWLGNCVFCFKKSDLKLAAAQRDEHEMYINWLEMIEAAPDRNKRDGMDSRHMYRKKRTLEQVVAMFDGSTGEEIKRRIRGRKLTDSGSCSESCEAFGSGLEDEE